MPRYVPTFLPPAERPLRAAGFGWSLILHAALIVALGLISGPVAQSERDDTAELFRLDPAKHRVIYYDFRKQRLPALTPKAAAQNREARAPEKRLAQNIVVAPPKARPVRQIVWHAAPKIRLQQDLDAANIVVLNRTVPPPPPAPKPDKAFVAPPRRRTASAAVKLEALPNLQTPVETPRAAADNPLARVDIRTPRTTFAAPARPAVQPGKVVFQTADLPPVAGALPTPAAPAAVAPRRDFMPPPPPPAAQQQRPAPSLTGPPPEMTARTAAVQTVGGAILGLDPGTRILSKVPEASRSGQIGSAAQPGPVTVGAAKDAEGQLPHGSISGGPPVREAAAVVASARPSAAPPGRAMLREIVLPSVAGTFAAPLHAAARTLPMAVEREFLQRVVYASLIPIEKIPGYNGDWMMWFAEREPRPGESPKIIPPMPLRRRQADDTPVLPLDRRIQLAAIIRKDGQVDQVRALNRLSVTESEQAVADLRCWEFRPALRNGLPTEVDVVLDISFRR